MDHTPPGAMIVDDYLNKYALPGLSEFDSNTTTYPLIVTIPAYREPLLLETLDALFRCKRPEDPIAVLVLINYKDITEAAWHEEAFNQAMKWAQDHSSAEFLVRIFIKRLPPKKAGVGMARKLLMDEALRHIRSDGVIACLDADATVDDTYLKAVISFFGRHPQIAGASIHYEHPLDGPHRTAILLYELHLRYYVEAQRWLNLPYAFHTVGSSMAVRPDTYAKTGGMNLRKAGEDFYFLQKIMPHGFGTIVNTTVYPSDRISDRVPFGTGKSVGDYQQTNTLLTYAPASFELLKTWLNWCENHWNSPLDATAIPPELASALESQDFAKNWQRIQNHSKSYSAWRKHFYAWFNGFSLMKVLHTIRDEKFPNIPVTRGVQWLLNMHEIPCDNDPIALLKQLRRMEIQSANRFSL